MEYDRFSYSIEEAFFLSYKSITGVSMPNHHFHSNYEVFFLIEGERRFFIKDRTISIKGGDLIIIKPNVLHMTTNGDNPVYSRVVINFQECFLSNPIHSFLDNLKILFEEDYVVIRFTPHHKLYIEDLFKNVMNEAKERNTGFELQIQSLVLQLLIFCCRYVKENEVHQLHYLSPVHERVSEVVRYINENYDKSLTLQDLAERFYVSSYYLSRVFKEVTGISFVQYLNSIRIKEAKKLLEETNLKVFIIAEKTGFGSITHFGRVFKEVTGKTPRYFRQMNLKI